MARTLVSKRIVTMKIAKLKTHSKQLIHNDPPTEQEIADLAKSLRRNGLINAIEILSDGTIICGHRRVAAAKSLGWPDIACWIREDLESEGDDAVEWRLIEDNAGRQQYSLLRMAQSYKRLRELDGVRPAEVRGDLRDYLGKRFGVTGRTLDRWAKLLDAPPVIQQAVIAKRLRLEVGCQVASFSAEAQEEIVDRITNGEAPRVVVAEYVEERRVERSRVYDVVARLCAAIRLYEQVVAVQLEGVYPEYWKHELPTLQRAGASIQLLYDHIANGDAENGRG